MAQAKGPFMQFSTLFSFFLFAMLFASTTAFVEVQCPTPVHCLRGLVEQAINVRHTISQIAKHSAPQSIHLPQLFGKSKDDAMHPFIQSEAHKSHQVVRWLGMKERQTEDIMRIASHLLATLRPVVDEKMFYGGGSCDEFVTEFIVDHKASTEEAEDGFIDATQFEEKAGSDAKGQGKQSGVMDQTTKQRMLRDMYLDKLEVLHHILNRAHRLQEEANWKVLEDLEDSVVLLYDLFKEEEANNLFNQFEGEDEEDEEQVVDVKGKEEEEGEEEEEGVEGLKGVSVTDEKAWRRAQRMDLFKWIDSEVARWGERSRKGSKGIDGLFSAGHRTFSFSSSSSSGSSSSAKEPNELEKIVAQLLKLQSKKKTKNGEYILSLDEEDENALKEKLLDLWSSGKYNDQIKVMTWTYDGNAPNKTDSDSELPPELASSFSTLGQEEVDEGEEGEEEGTVSYGGEEEEEEEEEKEEKEEKGRGRGGGREKNKAEDDDEEEIIIL